MKASIRESVDSLCRDGADAQYMELTLKQKLYNFTTNTQKAYLSTQASSLSDFVISKTHKWPKATRKTAKRKKCMVAKVSLVLRPQCSTTIHLFTFLMFFKFLLFYAGPLSCILGCNIRESVDSL